MCRPTTAALCACVPKVMNSGLSSRNGATWMTVGGGRSSSSSPKALPYKPVLSQRKNRLYHRTLLGSSNTRISRISIRFQSNYVGSLESYTITKPCSSRAKTGLQLYIVQLHRFNMPWKRRSQVPLARCPNIDGEKSPPGNPNLEYETTLWSALVLIQLMNLFMS